MITYKIYFKSSDSASIVVTLEDTKFKADFLAYLSGSRLEARAYKKANREGDLIVDFREICAVDVDPG